MKQTMKQKNVILSAAAALGCMGFASTSQAATILPVVESGTWFNTGSDASNEAVTVFGRSGNTAINTNGGFDSLFVVDTNAFVGTITGGTIAFSIDAGGNGMADFIAVDFLGTTADNDFDAAEGFGFASGAAVSSILSSTGVTAEDNTQTFSISLTGAQIAGADRYAVYRFSNPTLPNGANNNQQSGIANFSVTAIPEPSSTVLLGLGGLALTLRRRK